MKNESSPNGGRPRQAIIYVRVSSADQVEGTSLDDQEKRCLKYCEENGYTVLNVFREEGASAKTADRKILLDALEFCRKNKGMVDAFVVWKVDRFARNTEDHFGVRKILMDYGTHLLSVTEPIGDKPAEKLFEVMLAGFAEFDNAIRRQRCTNGMFARLQQGIWPWKPPAGYKCAHNKLRGEKKTKPDEPDENVFPLLQRMLKGFVRQVYTQADIVRELEKSEFEKLTGIKPSYQFTDHLLSERIAFYAGLLPNPWMAELGGERYIKGQHKPMISVDEMHTIRLIRTGGVARIIRDRNNPRFPLRRLVICPSCGRFLTGSTSSGRNRSGYSYYHCYNRECRLKNKAVAKAKIETDFTALLERVTPTEKFLRYFEHVVLTRWTSQIDTLKADARMREKTMKGLEDRRRNIFDMRERREYTPEQFSERMGEIENLIAVEKIAISETKIDQYDMETILSYAKQAITDIAKQWLNLVPTLRARFQKLIFPEGIAYDRDTGFGTVKLGCIFSLNREFELQKSPLVDLRGVEPRPRPCHGRILPLNYRPVSLRHPNKDVLYYKIVQPHSIVAGGLSEMR